MHNTPLCYAYMYKEFKSDMIFLRFQVEFGFPECPIPLNFITISFFCKVRVRVQFRILHCLGRFITTVIKWASIGWKFTITQWESALQNMFEFNHCYL